MKRLSKSRAITAYVGLVAFATFCSIILGVALINVSVRLAVAYFKESVRP